MATALATIISNAQLAAAESFRHGGFKRVRISLRISGHGCVGESAAIFALLAFDRNPDSQGSGRSPYFLIQIQNFNWVRIDQRHPTKSGVTRAEKIRNGASGEKHPEQSCYAKACPRLYREQRLDDHATLRYACKLLPHASRMPTGVHRVRAARLDFHRRTIDFGLQVVRRVVGARANLWPAAVVHLYRWAIFVKDHAGFAGIFRIRLVAKPFDHRVT